MFLNINYRTSQNGLKPPPETSEVMGGLSVVATPPPASRLLAQLQLSLWAVRIMTINSRRRRLRAKTGGEGECKPFESIFGSERYRNVPPYSIDCTVALPIRCACMCPTIQRHRIVGILIALHEESIRFERGVRESRFSFVEGVALQFY